jgi:hypothetical protein
LRLILFEVRTSLRFDTSAVFLWVYTACSIWFYSRLPVFAEINNVVF